MDAQTATQIAKEAIIKKITTAASNGKTSIWIKESQLDLVVDFLKENGYNWASWIYDYGGPYGGGRSQTYEDGELLYKVSWNKKC